MSHKQTAGKARLWRERLSTVVTRLQRVGHDVFVAETAPHPRGWFTPDSCNDFDLLPAVSRCHRVVPLSSEGRRQRPALAAERAALLRTRAKLLEVRMEICAFERRRAQEDRHWVYHEGLHISVLESRELAHVFSSSLGHA